MSCFLSLCRCSTLSQSGSLSFCPSVIQCPPFDMVTLSLSSVSQSLRVILSITLSRSFCPSVTVLLSITMSSSCSLSVVTVLLSKTIHYTAFQLLDFSAFCLLILSCFLSLSHLLSPFYVPQSLIVSFLLLCHYTAFCLSVTVLLSVALLLSPSVSVLLSFTLLLSCFLSKILYLLWFRSVSVLLYVPLLSQKKITGPNSRTPPAFALFNHQPRFSCSSFFYNLEGTTGVIRTVTSPSILFVA
jgi:hypothetical protein